MAVVFHKDSEYHLVYERLASYPGLQIAGGRPGIHCLRMLNVNITSILIVTFANGLGLTDDVYVNTPAYACMRAIKGLTTSTPQLFPLSTSPSL